MLPFSRSSDEPPPPNWEERNRFSIGKGTPKNVRSRLGRQPLAECEDEYHAFALALIQALDEAEGEETL